MRTFYKLYTFDFDCYSITFSSNKPPYKRIWMLKSAKIDLSLINFRQNLCDIRAFSWSTPTLVTLLQRI